MPQTIQLTLYEALELLGEPGNPLAEELIDAGRNDSTIRYTVAITGSGDWSFYVSYPGPESDHEHIAAINPLLVNLTRVEKENIK